MAPLKDTVRMDDEELSSVSHIVLGLGLQYMAPLKDVNTM